MAQKKIGVDQIESGKEGLLDLGTRLNNVDAEIENVKDNVANLDARKSADIAKVNEAIMAAASAPITAPVFNDIVTYIVQDTDVVEGMPTTITIPDGKEYKVGKGNMLVLRNGVPQIPTSGDYTEETETTVKFAANVLKVGDVITFIIGNPSKLNYTVSVDYYTEGDDEGRIRTISYSGDIERSITYTYTASGKIETETVTEDGKTTTKTYTYDEFTGRLIGINSVVS